MGEKEGYFRARLKHVDRKRVAFAGVILLSVLVVLVYSGLFRPLIVIGPGSSGLQVKNDGDMDALIYNVDGFWYWGGQVAVLANLPDIHQRVLPGAEPVRLQVPDIPTPEQKTVKKHPWYMKLVVSYRIPGIPIFRYKTPLYFKYDPNGQLWAATKGIPAKYRSLGKLAMGNVGEVRLRLD
jgi:hypothetical protein